MSAPLHTRRSVLTAALRGGTAVAGTALAAPALARLLAATEARAATTVDSLAAAAPRARFWASSADPAVTCAACHGATPTGSPHAQPVVECLLCARHCVIADGQRGMCGARMNVGGELRSLVYGRPMAVHVDPIEKKPFYHFLPGSQAWSLATSGCPLRCSFCQNWQISQARPEDYDTPFRAPKEIAREAQARGTPVIAFTYNEPTVFTEYALDIAVEAKKRGIRSVFVSCGYMNEAPLAALLEVLSGVKIDLKGFSPAFYRNVVQAEIEPVKRSIRQVARAGVHLEIVNLVIPTLNDDEASLGDLARWVAGEIGPDTPVHFTRFHPEYRLTNLPPTPEATLERAWAIARAAGLNYVYVGNVPGHPANDTTCPGCGATLIARSGFFVVNNRIRQGACPQCGRKIPGVWV
ncbi:MAG: AmmeMemoRadiSam system radical SAM enzyme [Deltaproteobacteria bacterium]|nr:AmmeMemoRadiSam system radical SAM enzyme [Deltaproteobacteria bacterium]